MPENLIRSYSAHSKLKCAKPAPRIRLLRAGFDQLHKFDICYWFWAWLIYLKIFSRTVPAKCIIWAEPDPPMMLFDKPPKVEIANNSIFGRIKKFLGLDKLLPKPRGKFNSYRRLISDRNRLLELDYYVQ